MCVPLMCVQSVCVALCVVFSGQQWWCLGYVLSSSGGAYGASPYDIGLACHFNGLKFPSGVWIGYIYRARAKKGGAPGRVFALFPLRKPRLRSFSRDISGLLECLEDVLR